jgi:two-component system, OmpR family, sensor kinase
VRRPRLPRSFHQQIVAVTAGVTAAAMLLLALVLQIVLARISENDLDRVLVDRADAVISSASATPSGVLVVPSSSLDSGVAAFDSHGTLVAGDAPDKLKHDFEKFSAARSTTVRNVGEGARVLGQPFTTPDGASGVVVVAERLEPYEEAERLALIVSLVTGVLATLVAAAIAAWTTRRALRPVAVMAETATEWSEHDLSRRFDLGPPHNEISALAVTLDQLLDKVSLAIRSEQRLTSELAHELRTPLTTIQGMADLVLLRDVLPPEAASDLEEISAASQRMAVTITALLDLARNEATVLAASHNTLETVLAEVVGEVDAAGIPVTLAATDTRLDVPAALAVRAVSPVVENAVRFASTRVTISSRFRHPGSVEIVVEDDGPGLDASQAEVVFVPGTTGRTGTGSGLGLAIARRVARTVGGDVTAETGGPTTRFVIRLPRS